MHLSHHNLEVSNSDNGVHGGSEDEEYSGDSINVQRMGPYQFKLLEP